MKQVTRRRRNPVIVARFAEGLKQSDVMELTGLSGPTIVKIENKPLEATEESLAKYLAVIPEGRYKRDAIEWLTKAKQKALLAKIK